MFSTRKMNLSKFKAGILIGSVLIFGACGGNSKESAENASGASSDLSGTINIDGSSTVYPITEAVAEEFRTEAPNVKVTIGISGTGGGFKKFVRGETDINNSSRSISESEAATAKENGITYLELPVTYDGLTVVVNPANDWVTSLTVAELKKIWEPAAQGKITRWNQIRPEWPNEEIRLYGAGVESGTYDYFTEAIVGKARASRGDYTASEDDNVLVQGVSTDKNALGFFGYAYYDENKAKLKAIAIDDQNEANGKGAILPSVQTVKDGSYAPLSRPLFIYVNSKAAQRPEVVKFVEFYLDVAKDLSAEVGYIPMEDKTYDQQKQKFADFTGGQKQQ